MEEVWKDVAINTNYEVSNLGKVRRKKTGKVLGETLMTTGYIQYTLPNTLNNGERLGHRIVARAFCEGYKPGYHVVHIDGDKLNNEASNLEWVKPAGKGRASLLKVQVKPVLQLDKETGNIIKEFSSVKEASQAMNTGISTIASALERDKGTSCGYMWKFKNKKDRQKQKKQKVQAVHKDTGEEIEFSSIRGASRFLNVKSPLLKRFKEEPEGFLYKNYYWYKK